MKSQSASTLLRVVTQRLSSTPFKQLPHISPYLATIIAQHGNLLAASTKEGQVAGETESAVVVHKLRTQLSALLQDKNPEARYAAVILIKSTVEVGGWKTLQGVGAWVRGLIGILGKPDIANTKTLCIITLTRIFLLTHEHQSLVREITTPSLPGFIAACLNLTKNSRSTKAASELYIQSPLLPVILYALSELIAMHPTLFRPFVSQIHSLAHPLIAPTPSNSKDGDDSIFTSAASVSASARRLFVLLHVTGPKNTAAEEWIRSLDALVTSAQKTADKVFRSLAEDWTSSKGNYELADLNLVEDVVSDQAPTPLALPAWTGIHAGLERLDGLLHTLQTFLATATAATITLPIGNILSLVGRILSVLPPGNGKNPQLKPEIGRDEREGLWVGLPRLQTSAIGVCSLMISRMGHSSAAIAYTILQQLLWTLESQYGHVDFRKAAYTLVSQILSTFGPSLPKSYVIALSRCVRMCCEDLLPSIEFQLQGEQASFPDSTKATNGVTFSTNADSYLKSATNRLDPSVTSIIVLQAAQDLLLLALTNLPNDFLPFSLRCQIDRTAIITNNRKVMLASAMNPISRRRGQKQISSILPLLARAHPEALQVEALLRPQMPPVQSRRSDETDIGSDKEGDTYAPGHPDVGKPDGFYRDLGGTDESAKVIGNITSGHSGVQEGATSGLLEEGSPRTQPTGVSKSTAAGFQESKSAFSYTSKKRDREEKLNIDSKEGFQSDSTEQTITGVGGKRLRVVLEETQKETPQELAPSNPATVGTGGTGQAVKKNPPSDSAAVLDRQSNIQQEGSDESEFEMPVLHLDPDSDEEDEDEEEEEDE